MIRDDLEILTDEEVDTLIVSTRIFIFDYLKNYVVNEVIAMDIANRINNKALWKDDLENIISSTIEDIFYQLDITNCDVDKIKKVLESEYKIKITKDNPIEIIKLESN
ncbi:MAG: hypothetical protein E7161_01325 [Firmicutes bacterium]|nr:hypothetical protein [Bacillota bacterium]